MVELILFITLGIGILIAFEIRARKHPSGEADPTAQRSYSDSDPTAEGGLSAQRSYSDSGPSDGCCGTHLVCERETLLQTNAEIVYYDDEELDVLAGIPPEDYTSAQHDAIAEVFHSLQEKDVPGWCRSLQLRHIELPLDIREEALLIVRERRVLSNSVSTNEHIH